MWHINVIVNMAAIHGSFLPAEQIALEIKLFTLYGDVKRALSQFNNINLDLGAFIYMLDGLQRRIFLKLEKNYSPKKWNIEELAKLYVVSLIVGAKHSSDFPFKTSDFLNKEYCSSIYNLFYSSQMLNSTTLLVEERTHLKLLDYKLIIPLNRIGKFLDYLTDKNDQKEVLEELKSHYLNIGGFKKIFAQKFPHYDVRSYPMAMQRHRPLYIIPSRKNKIKLENILREMNSIKIDYNKVKNELNRSLNYYKYKKINLKNNTSVTKKKLVQDKINAILALKKTLREAMEWLKYLQNATIQYELRNSETGSMKAEIIYHRYKEFINEIPKYKIILSKISKTGLFQYFWQAESIKGSQLVNYIFKQFEPLTNPSIESITYGFSHL